MVNPSPPICISSDRIKIPGRLNVSINETGDNPVTLNPLVEMKRASKNESDTPSLRLNGNESKMANPTVNKK